MYRGRARRICFRNRPPAIEVEICILVLMGGFFVPKGGWGCVVGSVKTKIGLELGGTKYVGVFVERQIDLAKKIGEVDG